MAEWLNTTFYALDSGMFKVVNGWAVSAGGFLTPFFKFVSVFGASGIFFIILSLVFIAFKKTRYVGTTMLASIIVGALFTNIILKNTVARPRPYTREEFAPFWQVAGAVSESEYSFPSGHTTVTMASMMTVFLTCNKKWSFSGFFIVILMAISRVYLIAHYLTDVLAGMISGGIAGVIGYFVVKAIYKWAEKNKNKKFFDFCLNFDLIKGKKYMVTNGGNLPEETTENKGEPTETTENTESNKEENNK